MEPSLRARVRGGDQDAFGELFDEHVGAVYNQAFRSTMNWSTAEEVVSLTFLEAWRLRARVDQDGGSLRPWLLGIAVNVTRNLRRASRRHEAAVSRIPVPRPAPDFADDVIGQLDDLAALRAVLAAVETLRPGERDVLALCVWSDLDYASAAEALGVPISTVRSRLARARDKLRRAGLDREPAVGRGQVEGDREPAVRSLQEETR